MKVSYGLIGIYLCFETAKCKEYVWNKMLVAFLNGFYPYKYLIFYYRALLFFELVFQETIACLKLNNYESGMKKIFSVAYEGSVKKYHNWVTQQIFTVSVIVFFLRYSS